MAGRQDEYYIVESLRYLSQSIGALLRGASGDAREFLDMADEEIGKVRVRGGRPATPPAPDEPELPPTQEQGAET